MRPWDFDTSASRLRKATEDLQLAWELTAEQWQDEVSQNFCEKHLEPLGPAMKMSLDAVARMRQLMTQVQAELDASTE